MCVQVHQMTNFVDVQCLYTHYTHLQHLVVKCPPQVSGNERIWTGPHICTQCGRSCETVPKGVADTRHDKRHINRQETQASCVLTEQVSQTCWYVRTYTRTMCSLEQSAWTSLEYVHALTTHNAYAIHVYVHTYVCTCIYYVHRYHVHSTGRKKRKDSSLIPALQQG